MLSSIICTHDNLFLRGGGTRTITFCKRLRAEYISSECKLRIAAHKTQVHHACHEKSNEPSVIIERTKRVHDEPGERNNDSRGQRPNGAPVDATGIVVSAFSAIQ